MFSIGTKNELHKTEKRYKIPSLTATGLRQEKPIRPTCHISALADIFGRADCIVHFTAFRLSGG